MDDSLDYRAADATAAACAGVAAANTGYREFSDPRAWLRPPSVSVLMLAHRHAPYLRQAMESVLAQECDFDFELLVGEDASGDGSLEIALALQQAHPDKVRVIQWLSNVGMHANQRQLFALARGEFLAYCEGDDWWCHPGKLVAQRALLMAHPEAGCVHADWVRAREISGQYRIDWHRPVHRHVDPELLAGDLFPVFHFPKILRTCTLMQRRSAVEAFHASPLAQGSYRFVDTVRSSYIASRWPVLYWPQVAAVYRESPGSALRSGNRAFIAFLRSSLDFDSDARRYYAGRADYPDCYRWECGIGLMLRGTWAWDWKLAWHAWRDLQQTLGWRRWLQAAAKSLWIRRPWPRPGLLRRADDAQALRISPEADAAIG